MKDSWWCKKAEEMQEMADRHDSQGLFAALKVVYGPRSNAVAPVKGDDCTKLYTNLNDIQGRWKEHFQKLLNQEGTADQSACQWLRRRPTREDICEPITVNELEKAMRTTRNGKAPGQDGIAAEVLKYGCTRLKEKLLELYNTCLEDMVLPQDFKDALVETICKKMEGEKEVNVGTTVGFLFYPLLGKC